MPFYQNKRIKLHPEPLNSEFGNQEDDATEALSTYSWHVPKEVSRFLIYGFFAFLVVLFSLFSWRVNALAETVDLLKIEGNGQIGNGAEFQYFEEFSQFRSGVFVKTDIASRLNLLFDGRNSVRLDRDTEILVQDFQLSSDDMILDIELLHGNVWINTTLSSDMFRVKVSNFDIIVHNAAVNVSKDQQSISVYADRHSAEGLFPESIRGSLESFLVPERMVFKIDFSELTRKLGQLRYSKFKKEFLSRMPSKTLDDDEWFSVNRQKDRKIKDQFLEFWLSAILEKKVPAISSGTLFDYLNRYYYALGQYFILDDAKKDVFFERAALHSFFASQYLFAADDLEDAKIQLLLFQELLKDFSENTASFGRLRQILFSPIQALLREYAVILPDSVFYEVKEVLRELQFIFIDSNEKQALQFVFLREKLYEIFDLIDENKNTQAKRSFLHYKVRLFDMLQASDDTLTSMKHHLLDEYQIIYNLFSEHSMFFEQKYFAVFHDLEETILDLLDDDIDIYETRLAFINNKLRILEKLTYFMKTNDISIEKALVLGEMLLKESEALRKEKGEYDVAVDSFFAAKIEEYEQMFRFFSSSDYKLLHGVYDESAFIEFQETERNLEELIAYLDSLEDDESLRRVRRVNVEDFIRKVYKDFSEYSISILDVSALDDSDLRLFSIGDGTVDGKSFRAKYDREHQILYDLQVGEYQLTTSGIHLKNLRAFIRGVYEEASKDDVPPDIDDKEELYDESLSREEKAFVLLLIKRLDDFNIIASSEDVVVLDLEDKLFWVDLAQHLSDEQVVFSFEFDLDQLEASSVAVETSLGKKKVTGSYTLSKLFSVVSEVYERAEKQYENILEGV